MLALTLNLVGDYTPAFYREGGAAAWLVTLLLVFVSYNVVSMIYNVYFHPLSKFPGPRLAAASRYWTLMQDMNPFQESVYEDLHKKYATKALRIGPNELHITDISAYEEIYRQNTPYLKTPRYYDAFRNPGVTFTLSDAAVHKDRRRLLNPMFSKAGVMKYEPVIHAKVKQLFTKIDRLNKAHGKVNAWDAMRCLAGDIIGQIAFARSSNMIDESHDSFHAAFPAGFDSTKKSLWVVAHNPWVLSVIPKLPRPVLDFVLPGVMARAWLREFSQASLMAYHDRKAAGKIEDPTLLQVVEPLPLQLQAGEATSMLIAGSDTTASTLSVGLLYILSTPGVEAKLREALKKDEGDFSVAALEKNEYLAAIVKESLRVALAVPGRLERTVPPSTHATLKIDNLVVPPGTTVGMSTYTMHFSSASFGADVHSFVPERWLGPNGMKLEHYFAPFSKGSRMCIGMNLANMELFVVFAYLFRTYNMTLVGKREEYLRKRLDQFVVSYKGGIEVVFERR